jgi:hypothetical protein
MTITSTETIDNNFLDKIPKNLNSIKLDSTNTIIINFNSSNVRINNNDLKLYMITINCNMYKTLFLLDKNSFMQLIMYLQNYKRSAVVPRFPRLPGSPSSPTTPRPTTPRPTTPRPTSHMIKIEEGINNIRKGINDVRENINKDPDDKKILDELDILVAKSSTPQEFINYVLGSDANNSINFNKVLMIITPGLLNINPVTRNKIYEALAISFYNLVFNRRLTRLPRSRLLMGGTNNNDKFKHKYLKYKTKYIKLQKELKNNGLI